jgi:ribosome-associated protein YbcJ (S4-like RNA binding protein)
MKRRELKEMIKAAFIAENSDDNLKDLYDFKVDEAEDLYEEDLDEMIANLDEADEDESIEDILTRITGTSVDPYQAEGLAEAEGDEEETDVEVDAEAETTDGGEEKNDSIVVDKKIVSLSSLPNETRKILDSLETLRAQAEEFGDQKFITQVGNTITFFTRDFVVAGDEPTRAKVDESLEILKMKKLAGLLTEGEYAKALLRENQTNFPSEDEIKRKGAVGDSVTVSKDGKNYDINYTISSESDDEMSFGIYDSEEGEDAEQIEEFYTYKELINWFNN